ncbi:MAG TPA: undecaprenyldiphospho-muramoylpentapeptide beta-N-acetylglucosaminyltransferase [Peptococcaceae bacterium]|nr:MAG: UDP-N-acetylglucosamine--N-acetylmuramyl-(pentapeptide) pyrophosphoryl-undecaprenol N-acetylglucosamine transferase [Moorella sp. 60_41]HBT48132.1 undecaprenyldiphospho-muramoylpentapeptide beta-N-acetylglucosaminyltransferase [Peptococcaceae bacterium]
MRVVVTGGGTGGHVYPALAIAQGLKRAEPEAEILYIGTRRGLEADVIPRAGFPLETITVRGLERRRIWKNFLALALLGRGTVEAYLLIRRFRPHVVVGTGGYVCGPVCLVAAALGIPVVLHEQNAFPGMTNRWLARIARTVCLTFPEAAKFFPRGAELVTTGLPVRPEILRADRAEARKRLGIGPDDIFILSVGGSQGARSLNRAILPVLQFYSGQPSVRILHVTGRQGYEALKEDARRFGIEVGKNGNITIEPYLYEMDVALAAADLVVGRAGASFLAEVLARGLPAVLIPYPFAAANHQEYNARAVASQGAAVVIRDHELRGGKLLRTLQSLLAEPSRLKAMAEASLRLGRPDALERIVERILAVAHS